MVSIDVGSPTFRFGAYAASRDTSSSYRLRCTIGPRRRGADLPGVEGPHAGDRADGDIEVGVVEHERGALAAELEQQPLHRLAAGFEDALADGRRPGEADHVDVVRLGERDRRLRARST